MVSHKYKFLEQQVTPQMCDKKRRSRVERSISANSRYANVIYQTKRENLDNLCENPEDDDSPKEVNVSKLASGSDNETPDPNEKVLFSAKDISDKNIGVISPEKDEINIVEPGTAYFADLVQEHQKSEERKSDTETHKIERNINSSENDQMLETRIRPAHHIIQNSHQNDTQQSCVTNEAKLPESSSSNEVDLREESKSNIEAEGEGDIQDTIYPLIDDNFTEITGGRNQKLHSEPNHGRL